MFDICFVVLHYMAFKATVAAVNSIMEKCDTKNYKVIIVDNASPDQSGKLLSDKYESEERVCVLINPVNTGFSAGNNTGYRYAKEVLKSKYIVLMNNDIILKSNNVFRTAEADFAAYGFAVMGPKIFKPEDSLGIQNPVNEKGYTKRELLFKKYDHIIWILLSYFHLEKIWIKGRKKLVNLLRRLFGKRKAGEKDTDYYNHIQTDVILHGCFWLLSPQYISAFDGLEEWTFMYHEELILSLQVKHKHMVMMYEPAIEIFHEHMASTNCLHSSLRESKRIRYKRELDSVKIVLNQLKGRNR